MRYARYYRISNDWNKWRKETQFRRVKERERMSDARILCHSNYNKSVIELAIAIRFSFSLSLSLSSRQLFSGSQSHFENLPSTCQLSFVSIIANAECIVHFKWRKIVEKKNRLKTHIKTVARFAVCSKITTSRHSHTRTHSSQMVKSYFFCFCPINSVLTWN